VLRHLGAVQLDTISVLARSHELDPYARPRPRTGPVRASGPARRWWRAEPRPDAAADRPRRPVDRALAFGDLFCTERRSLKRVYELAEQSIPADLFGQEPTDAECLRRLVAQAGAALGVAT
ncbi:hypothetical protein UK12_33720, partial [Saccharothrix sp. ST-888]